MAAKIKIPKLESSTFKGWAFVLVAGVGLALLALLDRGSLAGVTGSTGCVVEVVADEVNVRSTPGVELAPVDTLHKGKLSDAERVVTNGFRKLGDGRWALDSSLRTQPGSHC